MYICKKCGNKKYFDEYNSITTHLSLDEGTGEVQYTEDEFITTNEVVCGVCGATSEDGQITDRQGEILRPGF